MHRRILREAFLQVGGAPLRSGRIARERQRISRRVLHIAAFGKLQRQVSALDCRGRISAMRVAYRFGGLVEGGIFALAGLLRHCNGALPHSMRRSHLPGLGEHHGLVVRHPVLDMLSSSAYDLALHPGAVVVDKRQVVTGDEKFRDFQFPRRSPLQNEGAASPKRSR
ncbi:MAG: hypothetical protein ACJ746_22870 [Bryobacteraceae bacterium]